jgi:hypothetical protein
MRSSMQSSLLPRVESLFSNVFSQANEVFMAGTEQVCCEFRTASSADSTAALTARLEQARSACTCIARLRCFDLHPVASQLIDTAEKLTASLSEDVKRVRALASPSLAVRGIMLDFAPRVSMSGLCDRHAPRTCVDAGRFRRTRSSLRREA